MSELDQDQAGSTADEAHDNPGTLDDEIEPIINQKIFSKFGTKAKANFVL